MIRHHLAVWWTGIDRGTAALATTAAAGLVAGAVMLVLVHSHRTGIPAITLALPGLIGLWACCTVASAFTISPRPVVRCRVGVPDAAALAGAPGTAAPVPAWGAGAGAAHKPAVVRSPRSRATAVPQDSQGGGEVRDAQPAPGVPVLAGAASRCDAGPSTLPRTQVIPRVPNSGWAPGPQTPSRVTAGWAVRPAVTSRAAGRHQLPARARSRVRYAPGRATVPPGAAVTQIPAAAAPGTDHQTTTAPADATAGA